MKTNFYRFYFYLLSFSLVVYTGCLTPKKMDKWVAIHFDGREHIRPKSNEAIRFQTGKSVEGISETGKQKSNLLPLLFYWQWDHITSTSLNGNIALDVFSSSFIQQASSNGLKAKIGENKLMIGFGDNPADFIFKEKGSLIYLLIAYIGWESIYIKPKDETIKVSYLLTDKTGNEIKKGIIVLQNPNKEQYFKKFQSLKKLTWSYLDNCEANLKLLSRELVEKLLAEL